MSLNPARCLFMEIVLLFAVMGMPGCFGKKDYQAFLRSHDAIRPGMTLREVFDAGLADYMIGLRNKNVPGSTLPAKQPASKACKRHVLDIQYFKSPPYDDFWVRVYCEINTPSAKQVIPEQSFKNKQDFLQALDTVYSSWAKSMRFTVESPPLRIGGVYDHYTFTTNEDGKVASVSSVILSSSR